MLLLSNPFFNHDDPIPQPCTDARWCAKRTGRRNMTLSASSGPGLGHAWGPLLNVFRGPSGYSSLAQVPTPAGSPVRVALAYERSDDWPLTFAELHVAVIELAV